MKRVVLAMFATTALVALAGQQKHDLSVHAKVGDKFAYRLQSTIEAIGASGKLDFSARFEERLASMAKGELHWDTSFSNVEASASGVFAGGEAQFKQMNGMRLTSVQDARGRVLRLRANGQDIPSQGSANVVLPPRPVALGATWDAPIDVGGRVLAIRYRLAGFEKLGLRQAARIEGTYPKGSMARAISPTTFWVEVKTGKMIRGTALTMIEAEGKKIRLRYRIDRI